eukprot:COSAG06_NODE_42482_length_381_cov_0.953901_1_plen_89_part_01
MVPFGVASGDGSPEKTVLHFDFVPYACPEPVLVKCSLLVYKMDQRETVAVRIRAPPRAAPRRRRFGEADLTSGDAGGSNSRFGGMAARA